MPKEVGDEKSINKKFDLATEKIKSAFNNNDVKSGFDNFTQLSFY